MASLLFLGTGNAFGQSGRRHSAYLFQAPTLTKNPFKVLVDCGPSILPALHENNIMPQDIDLVYISHLHADHMLGIPLLVLYNRWIGKKEIQIPLVGPLGTTKHLEEICRLIYSEEEVEFLHRTFEIHEIPENDKLTIGEVQIRTYEAIHGGNGRMAIIQIGNKSVGYSGDTALHEESFYQLLNSDIVVHEASTFDLPIPNHTTVMELLNLPDLPESPKIFLSHVDNSVINNKSKIPPPFYLAEDNMVVEF